MPSPQEAENRKRGLFVLGVILLAVIISGFWTALKPAFGRLAGDFLYPYLISFRIGADSLSDQTLLVFSRRELASRLEEQLAENRRLAAQAAAASELLVENDALRRMLSLTPPASWRYTNVEIILRDPRFWNERFTIDRGSRDGIRPGAAALASTLEGQLVLVGVVDRVNLHSAEVITIFNPELKISASLPLSKAIGVINASAIGSRMPEDRIAIGFLPVRSDYIIDEILLSSGLEQQIPPGVKIGNLAEVEPADSRFSSRVFLTGSFLPALQLNSIRFLVIADRIVAPRPAEEE